MRLPTLLFPLQKQPSGQVSPLHVCAQLPLARQTSCSGPQAGHGAAVVVVAGAAVVVVIGVPQVPPLQSRPAQQSPWPLQAAPAERQQRSPTHDAGPKAVQQGVFALQTAKLPAPLWQHAPSRQMTPPSVAQALPQAPQLAGSDAV